MNREQSEKIRVNWEELEYQEYLAYYKDQPFTGIAEEYLGSAGAQYLYNETEFVDGLQHGLSRIYSETNQLLVEKTIYKGVAHGVQREWHDSGRLACEAIYDRGYCVRRIKWDEEGTEIEQYELRQLHTDYKMLERYRKRDPDWPEVPRTFTFDNMPQSE